ncbi:MAG TPA: hypothetical protein VN887_09405 [Candidatus Angelobacter sp.]|nr:hypothetical protein [Candidatus Angelobacter sp.]
MKHFLLVLCLATSAAGSAIGAERQIPPPGIQITAEDRRELESGARTLGEEIESLRRDLKQRPPLLELLPDVEIFHKAVDWALRYDEFYRSNEVQLARVLLKQGGERAAQLRQGAAPWATATGLVVRGYVSKIDGSVQPYGLIVPASFVRKPQRPARKPHQNEYRLDVWLHGRDDHLTELKFISEREKSFGEFAPTNAFVLHPYGRYCNAFKFAGEVDVLEAWQHVRRNYPIDGRKVALRGFSMGGAGAWHLGVHYSGDWAVVAPGAGFANTADYLRIPRGAAGPPWYEQKLWHLYDATDDALNLFNTTVVAYSGEIDKQKAAADAMAVAMKPEGLNLVHVIGPNTAHRYEPNAKREVARLVDEAAAHGRNPLPPKVRLTTWTLRINRMSWMTVEGLRKHWQRAIAEAEIVDSHTIKVRAENVTALTLSMPAGLCPLATVPRPELILNGQNLDAPVADPDGSWNVRLVEEGGRWSLVHGLQDGGLHKRHGLQGPIDDAFLDSFIMVEPTGKPLNESVGRWTTNEMAKAIGEWRNQFRGDAPVRRDDEVKGADIAANNLVLWGDPRSNKLLAKIAGRLPIHWDAREIRVREERFESGHDVPVLIYPNPLNPRRYVVLNSGFTFAHPRSTSNADQTPKLPDHAVVDINGPSSAGVNGKVVEAGFFDEEWKLAEAGK